MCHITAAAKEKYLESLKYEYTDLITDDILTVLDYLFSRYRKVQVVTVQEKEAEILNNPFVPFDPMITIHRTIEQLNNYKSFP